jgi:hypothetical protein
MRNISFRLATFFQEQPLLKNINRSTTLSVRKVDLSKPKRSKINCPMHFSVDLTRNIIRIRQAILEIKHENKRKIDKCPIHYAFNLSQRENNA